MKSKIINIPLNDNIVEYTAKHLLDLATDTENDFSGIAVVMPSKRPAMFIKRELAKQINKPFIPPKFFNQQSCNQSRFHVISCSFFIFILRTNRIYY